MGRGSSRSWPSERSGRAAVAWWLAVVLVAAPSCREGCAGRRAADRAGTPPAHGALSPGELGPGELRVSAAGAPTLALRVVAVVHGAGRLELRARAPDRGGWLYALEIEHALEATDLRVEAPQGGGLCRARYLQEGRATEADLTLGDVRVRRVAGDVEAADPIDVELTGRCTKLFERTRTGAPHAAALPDELRVEARFRVVGR